MRWFLSLATTAILVFAVATPVNAGYIIIRIILEGSSGGGADASHAGPGMISGGGTPNLGLGQRPIGGPGGSGGSAGGPPGKLGGPGGMPGTAPPTTHIATDPARSVVVVVPIEEDLSFSAPFYPKRPLNLETNPTWRPKLHTTYRGEKYLTNLFTDGSSIQLYTDRIQYPTPKKTRLTEVKELHAKWTKAKTDPSKTDPTLILLTALKSALAVGMIEDAVAYSDELLAFAGEKPDGLPVDVAAFVAAYGKMQKGIKGAATKPSKAENWQLKLGANNLLTQHHFALISWDATAAELKRRSDILEENFKAFFLWHATRGIALTVPDVPLLVVLPKNGNDVLALAKALDAPARLVADGFYSPENELLVLSPNRLDDVGMTFVRQTQQMYQAGISRDKLLAGDGPKLSVNKPNDGKKPEEVALMQTTALVELLVEDAATACAVSREGSRQLFYETRLLPKYVILPEWLNYGAGSFFARPKEPAFITSGAGKSLMHIATETGYGVPNYALQRYFKDLLDKKDLNPDRTVLLKNILTDAYFHGLRDLKDVHDPDPVKIDHSGIAIGSTGTPTAPATPGPGLGSGGLYGSRPPTGGPGSPPMGSGSMMGGFNPPGMGGANNPSKQEEDANVIKRKKRDRLAIKAQATSWALYYYLAKARPVELQNYLNELAAMPRDLSLEGATLPAFYRAFNLDGSKESLDKFAQSWLEFLHNDAPEGIDITLTEPKTAAPTGSTPMGPGYGPGAGIKP